MPVKWNTNRKQIEKEQEAFLSKLFGADWREEAEQRRKEEEAAERAKAPKFPRRA